MFEKDLNIGYLLDFYGEILSERKRDVMNMYYNEDFSLAEIASEIGISRQGVHDLIKKCEEELSFYEQKLGLAQRFSSAQLHASRIKQIISDDNSHISDELKNEIDALYETVK